MVGVAFLPAGRRFRILPHRTVEGKPCRDPPEPLEHFQKSPQHTILYTALDDFERRLLATHLLPRNIPSPTVWSRNDLTDHRPFSTLLHI